MYYWEKLFTSRANHFYVVLQTKLFPFHVSCCICYKIIGGLDWCIEDHEQTGPRHWQLPHRKIFTHINMFLWNIIGFVFSDKFDLMPKWYWIVEICMRFVTICRTNMIWCQSRSAEYWNWPSNISRWPPLPNVGWM